jgi:NADPH-dependent 7-cyano-7-deazaguanine reductase QueF
VRESTKKLLENQIKRVALSEIIEKRIANYKTKLTELVKSDFSGLCPFCKQPDSLEFCSCLDSLQKAESLSKPPVSRNPA